MGKSGNMGFMRPIPDLLPECSVTGAMPIQGRGEAVGKAHLVGDECTALLDQAGQGTDLGAFGYPRVELLGMTRDEVKEELSSAWIKGTLRDSMQTATC